MASPQSKAGSKRRSTKGGGRRLVNANASPQLALRHGGAGASVDELLQASLRMNLCRSTLVNSDTAQEFGLPKPSSQKQTIGQLATAHAEQSKVLSPTGEAGDRIHFQSKYRHLVRAMARSGPIRNRISHGALTNMLTPEQLAVPQFEGNPQKPYRHARHQS